MAINAKGQTIYQAPMVNGRVQTQVVSNQTPTNQPAPKITLEQATQSPANAKAFQAQNLAARNTSPIIDGKTMTTTNNVANLPQTNVPTQGTMLSADILAGQEATNQARLAELAVSQAQGRDTTTQAKQIADYLAGKTSTTPPQGTTTPATGTSVTNAPVDAVSQYKTNFEQSQADLMTALNNAQGQTGLQDQAYSSTVDPAKQELNTINQQINEVSLASRRRKEAVLTIPGITKEQAQDKLSEIDRQDTSKLADLAIIQMAKQGQYDSAKEIADRKVSALVEEQKIKIDTLKFVFDNNKELFTKAEQRQFEVAQADRERKLNQEEKRLQEVNAVALSALEAGAPTSVVTKMFNAKTLAEATKLGGQYVGALDRQVKLANIEQSKAAAAASNRANRQTSTSGVVAQLNPQQQIKFGQLTDDFDKETSNQRKIITSAQNIQSIAERAKAGEPTAQVALIYQYMKSLDPTSTVREGEYATAKNTTGLPGKVLNTYNSVIKGTFLNANQIDGYVNDSLKLAETANNQILNTSKEYDRRANVYGIPSGLVYQTSVGEVALPKTIPVSQEKEQIFNSVLGIPNSNPTKTTGNAIFGNQATTQTIIPFNLNNFKK